MNDFWAKKSDKNGFYWLPLGQHLEDTRQVCGLLWEHWVSEGVKNVVVDSLEDGSYEKAKNLSMFLGACHDIGKATPAFQIQKGFQNSEDLDLILKENLERKGFVGISTYQLANIGKTHHTLAGQALLESYGVNSCVSSIIGSHHGKPLDNTIKGNIVSYPSNYFQSENSNDSIYQLWELNQKNIYKWALESCGFNKTNDLPIVKQPGQIILSGLLIMADWIASNEKYFPLFQINENGNIVQSNRIKEGWEKWFNGFYQWEPSEYNYRNIYKSRFDFEKPRDVQEKMAEIIDNIDNPGIVILEAPMGIGKTEAALVAVEQLASKTGRSGMYFGLPTQATSDGIFPRIKSWLEHVAKEDENPQSIRLVHGKAAFNKAFSNLPKSSNIYDEDKNSNEENNSVIVNEWFSGRKVSMMDSFTVGTIDQFLLLALKQKHLALRHLGFSKKVVIIDEVHAYDAYMNVYLMEALKWMGAYGVPVVVLSATLPILKRNELIENYMRGCGYKPNKLPKPKNYDDNQSYPLITYNDGDNIIQFSDFEPNDGKNYVIKKIKRSDEENIYNLVDSLICDGGVIGIIVNTVKKAQELALNFVEIFGEEKVELLHSAFISTDRIRKERELLEIIGKGGERPKQKIIIGTQVIEQSLDIDFDVMISDLAPIDLLIQRVGRLHRHNIERSSTHKEPTLYVLGASDYDLDQGSEAVYGGYLLYRTEYFLSDKINIPNDISRLVQEVYSDKEIYLDSEKENIYLKYKNEHEEFLANKKDKAKHYRLSDPIVNKISENISMMGWLSNLNHAAQKNEEKAYAQVRDSGDTIEVIALKRCNSGYGFLDQSNTPLDISEPGISMEISKHTIKLPNAISQRYNIDKTIEELEKYNLDNLSDWQRDPWLKGSLGIIFDENNKFRLNGFVLSYDKKYGLMYEKESEDGKI